MTSGLHALPIRLGIFPTVSLADQVVADLLAAGFTKDNITVVCSEKTVQEHFKAYEHQDPAGAHTPAAVATGGSIGAALGGLAAIAGFATAGGAVLLIAGGLGLWTGGVVGSLVGAMMTRGFEKELANFYDQEVSRGKILVAVEQKHAGDPASLERASEIFASHGSHPMPLSEG